MEKVGFIGLGNMGMPMARRILQAGYPLVAYDIRPSAMEDIAKAGAEKASSPRELASQCQVILASLPSSPIVEEVILGQNGVIEGVKPGTVVIDMTTASPSSTRKIGKALEAKGVKMLDAPVSGGTLGAEAGTLAIMVGGEEEVFNRYQPLLSSIGKNIHYVGALGCGHVIKLVNNLVAFANRLTAYEGVVLAAKAGLSPQKAIEVMNTSSGRSFITEVTFPKFILPNKLAQGFTIGLAHKDIDTAIGLAKELGVPTFVGNVVEQVYRLALNLGGPSQEVNELIIYLEDWAGVRVRSQASQ